MLGILEMTTYLGKYWFKELKKKKKIQWGFLHGNFPQEMKFEIIHMTTYWTCPFEAERKKKPNYKTK